MIDFFGRQYDLMDLMLLAFVTDNRKMKRKAALEEGRAVSYCSKDVCANDISSKLCLFELMFI